MPKVLKKEQKKETLNQNWNYMENPNEVTFIYSFISSQIIHAPPNIFIFFFILH